MKIAIIGAGSIGFTRRLFADIVSVPELQDIEVALTDIDEAGLSNIAQMLRRTVAASKLPTRITATTDRRQAIEGARYVVSCVRVGGLEAYADDIRIPLKYGVDQCVGDTICAGGILYGQRNVPVILDFCRDIKELAEPDALFLNYANPMAINTWAAIEFGKVRTVGLCHGVQHGGEQIAEVLGAKEKGELEFICSGINHQTWYVDIRVRGRKVGKDELIAAFERHPVFSKQEKVRIDVLKRFGVYSTESNGHLSEYLPWYRKRPDETPNWVDMSEWIHGETGGYLRHCTERNEEFAAEIETFFAEAETPVDPAARSTEHASYIIEALETGRPYRGHFNVKNNGVIANLPADAIIEFDRLRRSFRLQHGGRHHSAGSLRGDLHLLDQRSAHGGPRRHRGRPRSAQAGGSPRSAHRRHLHAGGGLADGRRDGRGPGAMVATIRPCDRRRQGAPRPRDGQDARLGRRGAEDGQARVARGVHRSALAQGGRITHSKLFAAQLRWLRRVQGPEREAFRWK